MSKYINVPEGNYKVTVQEGGLITLDPGPIGTVVVTGNLTVQGQTTYLETTDSVIEDNIIILNRGETGNGITRDGAAGIRIDRGNRPDAQWLFVDNVTWTDTANAGPVDQGAWSPRDPQGRILGIETVSISTGGYDLNLLGQYTGPLGSPSPNPGKVTVSGTGGNYHLRVTDDDDIPNKKYVDDEIATFFANTVPNRIEEGIVNGSTTRIQVYDNSVSGGSSRVELSIDGLTEQEWTTEWTDLYGLRIEQTSVGTEIKTLGTSEEDLILSATGTGNVVIDDNLRIGYTPHEGDARNDPDSPTDGVLIYTKPSSTGGTGIFFTNTVDSPTNSDPSRKQRNELISRNRALVFSMLF